ncbi:succinate dehydrogenase cytochrome b subunit [Microscilla marina]|uniref:Succinate dehydrogenase, cytochrome b558 subunit n=1 Tax=Microscilla marina ATCC 23134 TaxID=313606 RepID=A1ZYL0_MICM2|nr:succinate dehydrogenase cytochrome b subunit [Microscilla marina]EAY24513.1 succinate dehydrogenase, cytochrome b558 subunit [Microscilla marina ATCC 23134]
MMLNKLFFRKWILAVTGLFLCLFLVVHLSANCLLLLPQNTAKSLYNSYSATLRESPLIKGIAYLLYLSILLHVLYALLITLSNRKANPVKYVVNKTSQNSTWSSQNMGMLGTLVLIFIVIHLVNFWARIKLGLGEEVTYDKSGNKDVYQVAYTLFHNFYFVLFYTLMAVPLAFHLYHGLKSGFKTLGFYHHRGLQLLAKLSLWYAVVMGIGFGIIPLVVYFK